MDRRTFGHKARRTTLKQTVMWNLGVVLFLTVLSAFGAARIVHLLSPWFSRSIAPQVEILIKVETIKEIDNAQYISFIFLFFVLYFINCVVLEFLHKRLVWISSVLQIFTVGALAYLAGVGPIHPFDLHIIRPVWFVAAVILSVVSYPWHRSRPGFMYALVAGVVLRHVLLPLLKFDIGPSKYVLSFDYPYIGIGIAVILYLALVARYVPQLREFIHAFGRRITPQRIVLAACIAMTISIVFLMRVGKDPIDTFFTYLPAYQVTKGAVPLVSAMSQYGFLYLAPWVLWIRLFPFLPITHETGELLIALLLIGYYCFLFILGKRLFPQRLILLFTLFAMYFYTILVRYFSFPDPVSNVSTPAFTPLRFGMFIFPLYFLERYVRGRRFADFRWFLIVTGLLFYYSFEIGLGMVLCGIAVSVVHALGKPDRALRISHSILAINVVLIGTYAAYSVVTVWATGRFPDLSLYTFYSRLYGFGYLMLPLDRQSVAVLPVGLSIAGVLFGLRLYLYERLGSGLIFLYVSLISLSLMPYYMGRSVYPTLYNISLPTVMLCGLFISHVWEHRVKLRTNPLTWVAVFVCGFVLFMGGVRGMVSTGYLFLHSAEIVHDSAVFVRKAVTSWNIRSSNKFAFLRSSLPTDCPLILFDGQEFELLPALGVRPAFQYGFIRGFITSREQVDSLTPAIGSDRICVFVTRHFLGFRDDLSIGIYEYFWSRFGHAARLLSADEKRGYYLYAIASKTFDTSQ